MSKICKVDFGIVSFYQVKAFHRVDYSYLFSVLRAFGFGDGFISWKRVLYICTQGMMGEDVSGAESPYPCAAMDKAGLVYAASFTDTARGS